MYNDDYSVGDFIVVKYYFPENYIVGVVTSVKVEGLTFIAFNADINGLPAHLSECYANYIRIINVVDYISDFESDML